MPVHTILDRFHVLSLSPSPSKPGLSFPSPCTTRYRFQTTTKLHGVGDGVGGACLWFRNSAFSLETAPILHLGPQLLRRPLIGASGTLLLLTRVGRLAERGAAEYNKRDRKPPLPAAGFSRGGGGKSLPPNLSDPSSSRMMNNPLLKSYTTFPPAFEN